MVIQWLTVLLACQLAGEVLSVALDLPIPGPVIGMALLFAGLALFGRLPDSLVETGQGLLNHLSLLFVPAGVGVVTHLGLIQAEWLPLVLALVISTIVAIAVTALVLVWLSSKRPADEEGEAAP
ncbi:MAG: CidA/LrgA family protein [Magnetovibrionaceae bacterium]